MARYGFPSGDTGRAVVCGMVQANNMEREAKERLKSKQSEDRPAPARHPQNSSAFSTICPRKLTKKGQINGGLHKIEKRQFPSGD